jgi:hypothetical protein
VAFVVGSSVATGAATGSPRFAAPIRPEVRRRGVRAERERQPLSPPNSVDERTASPSRTRTWAPVVDTSTTAPPRSVAKPPPGFRPHQPADPLPTRPAVALGRDPRLIIVNSGGRPHPAGVCPRDTAPFQDQGCVARRPWRGESGTVAMCTAVAVGPPVTTRFSPRPQPARCKTAFRCRRAPIGERCRGHARYSWRSPGVCSGGLGAIVSSADMRPVHAAGRSSSKATSRTQAEQNRASRQAG